MEKLPWETEFEFLKYKFDKGNLEDRQAVLEALKTRWKTIGPSKQLAFIFEDDRKKTLSY